ncbi:hypothetical protein BV898_10003 [Hypsibius exemplaris]|uniref:Uncharacterized protein n=1 Tax=Hypsibius exemplaris TaxID=2072580 RepID=A0A1W0WL68_HYPEX|nr:hypothetical protein BV898_10003 [Hypsibius exemplaris]
MEPHRLPQSVFAWGSPQQQQSADSAPSRDRSSSSPMSPSGLPSSGFFVGGMGSLSVNVPAVHLLPHVRSYPCSPQPSAPPPGVATVRSKASSSSYPVFPVNAQQQQHSPLRTPSKNKSTGSSAPRFREAVLHTKNPMAMGTPPPTRPKMHLYASDKKPVKIAPREEEFPEVPVEWLVGSPVQTPSDGSSISLSEMHSGDVSEDESDSSVSSFKSPTERSSPFLLSGTSPSSSSLEAVGDDSACHYLSVGLKAMLKVQA